MAQLLDLALHQPRDRHSGPSRYDRRDILLVHLFLDQAVATRFLEQGFLFGGAPFRFRAWSVRFRPWSWPALPVRPSPDAIAPPACRGARGPRPVPSPGAPGDPWKPDRF